MDPRTKLAKLKEWNALGHAIGSPNTKVHCKDQFARVAEELKSAGVNPYAFANITEHGRANLAALEAEVAGMEAKPEPVNARLAAVAPDMHAILSDAIALLEMTDEGSTPGTDSYTVCVLGNELLREFPHASTVGRAAPATPPTPTLRDQFAMAALTGIIASPTTSADASFQCLADNAYVYADAMLTARESRAPQPAGDGGTQKELADADRAASDLAMALWRKHYASASPHFALCNTVPGIIAQIDNMASGLTLDQSTRIRELEEALRPFAAESEEWNDQIPDDRPARVAFMSEEVTFEANFTKGDLRRAARVLGEVQP